MSPPIHEKKARLQPLISRISAEDAEAAATVQVNAMAGHTIQLRIQPFDERPAVPAQVKIKAQGFRDMIAAGNNRIIKAVVREEVAGVAIWNLVSNKKALVENGIIPLPPRERTAEDEEALKGVDVEIRKQIGKMSASLRNETMGDSKYWYLALLAVDPAYQYQGVGQALLQWGLDQAASESVAVYLESSDEGKRLYEKNGFELVGWNVLPDEKSPGGSLRWPAMWRHSNSS
ncbi:acyl-CoA N-acyltransferase [Mycena olivaceomarginata]|nr:acyl-CoA N-acyltransferase [Mycena olivaceomarginata]